jgi:hypothetical protein
MIFFIFLWFASFNASALDLDKTREIPILVMNIGDPRMIEFKTSDGELHHARFSQDWLYSVKERPNVSIYRTKWRLGYSRSLGPYVRMLSQDRISNIQASYPHPLEILQKLNKNCGSGNNKKMAECKSSFLALWRAEFERMLNKLENKHSGLVSTLRIYSKEYTSSMRKESIKARGSNANNLWISKQITFFKHQVDLMQSVTDW